MIEVHQIHRQRDTKMLDMVNGAPWETVNITTLRRNAFLFPSFLKDAKEHAMAAQVGKTVMYTSYGPEWRPFGLPRKKRPISSVILHGDTRGQILEDVKRFLGNWKWYSDRGECKMKLCCYFFLFDSWPDWILNQ
jgi:chaperone BCS1